MAIEAYMGDMEMCSRCSLCKFVPVEKIKGYRHVNVCPSVARYNFHAYSGGGRMNMAVANLQGRISVTDKLMEVVYNCQMCGACDISCKYAMDIDVLESLSEFRLQCVEDGHTNRALDAAVITLAREGGMVPTSGVARGAWAQGLKVKDVTGERAETLYHVGCRICADPEMWKVGRATVGLLQKAGVDVGIAGDHESCCGGRAYQMGYRKAFLRQIRKNLDLFERSGVRTLVTGCSDCYHSFKVLYDKFGMKGGIEVLHTAEFLDRLIVEGKLKPIHEVMGKVTYHDPCHLGRLGEPLMHWEGMEVPGQIRVFDPPREFGRGTFGIYEPPRNVIKNIPGLELVEMDRIKEYGWCCGAGGGVSLTNPDFALWTAKERVAEAESTGAKAIVTACPGCEQSLKKAIASTDSKLRVYDLVEVLEKTIQEGGP